MDDTLNQFRRRLAQINGIKLDEASKDYSSAPARMTNVGSEKYPHMVNTSTKLPLYVKKTKGKTHYVGGFKPPTDTSGTQDVVHKGDHYGHTGKKGTEFGGSKLKSYEFKSPDEKVIWINQHGHINES